METEALGVFLTIVGIAASLLSLWLLVLAIVVGHRYLQMNPGRPVGVSVEDWIRVRMLASGATAEQLEGKDRPSS